jgi:uncharacterized pyridoxamine 5'-phosphate oxidase family protein
MTTTNAKALHKTVHDFLQKQHTGVISTVSEEKQPWGSTIYFIPDDDLNLYFITRAKTKKYQNINLHPIVAITAYDEQTQTTVQASGHISQVPAREVTEVALEKLSVIQPKGDINWKPPFIKVHKGDWMVLKFNPNYMQYANYSEQKTNIHEDYIQKVIY